MSLELKRLELGKEATLVNTLNRILDNNQIVGVLDECGALQVSFGVRDYSTRLGACDGTRLNTVVEYKITTRRPEESFSVGTWTTLRSN
ncbi:hypothetical protein PC129_g4845 [Phytophthora cactorum]|uniref:Uncharacterized protein n=1 Tax=Phytophthora cactorum TaxID=29920 RepID=A0A8T1F592_9STRA|nr:hypothetical protein PC111_g22810 [Phytophthora cactorum]KAG2794344.1 hypothetical protein PC112_g23080 [Phytophthora cactorum]KAG2817404.1 hypothetical protein PC113_g22981 [Phytophthora cactorum]KAG2873575.1 hypothetical protein PC114_g25779 [Phytophthora cactorum]KAG2878973.1 hypothetical protein PC115_g22918 [Phytophthora cactorum]